MRVIKLKTVEEKLNDIAWHNAMDAHLIEQLLEELSYESIEIEESNLHPIFEQILKPYKD